MLKHTIGYTDFNNVQHQEDFYFHLSKADLTLLNLTGGVGLQDHLQEIISANEGQKIMDEFEKILKMAFGKKSEDGKSFIKDPEAWQTFRYSNAYDDLFMNLVTDAQFAAYFVRGIVPNDLSENVTDEVVDAAFSGRPIPQDHLPKKADTPQPRPDDLN